MPRYALVGLMVAALAGCEWSEKDHDRDSTQTRTNQSTMSQPSRTSANSDWNKSNTSSNANTRTRNDWDSNSNADMNRNRTDMNAQQAGARTENNQNQNAAAIDDRQFVNEAASAGLFEVKSAELAKDKGSSEMVKTYSDHLKQDHNQANQDLMGIANRKGIQVPTEMMPRHKATYDRLAGLSGAEFDRQFLQAQVQAHQQAVQLFENASKNAQDPDIKAFAAQYLPALRDHLKMAQDHMQHLSGNQSQQ